MKLDKLAFPLMGLIILLLVAASVAEQFIGTEAVVRYFYAAPWTIALWALTVVCAICYIVRRKVWQQPFTFLLHFSFVVILAGAMVTHLFGEQGKAHLRLRSDTVAGYAVSDSRDSIAGISLPFQLRLADFHLEYYPGTQAPMDFVSDIELTEDDGNTCYGSVSMNHIFSYRNYRFYQSGFDSDRRGTTLSISHDPWGIGITYAGYALLLLSIIGFFFQRRTYFRTLLRGTEPADNTERHHRAALIALFVVCLPLSASASKTAPPTINEQTAKEFCNLYVYFGDRVCPMQTLAKDFTVKLYGKPTYKGLSCEQVLCGWLFYYDDWANEPCIKIKGKQTRHTLGIEGKYACLNDFVGSGKYKLENDIRRRDKNAIAADEKFQLISMVCTARMLKIYPISTTGQNGANLTWYSWSDQLPPDITHDDWQFVYRSMDYVFLCVARNANSEAQDALRKIRQWQRDHAGEAQLPTQTRFKAEKIFNSLSYTRPMAMACATIGLLLFVIFILLGDRQISRRWVIALSMLMLLAFGVLTFALGLRSIISGHVPLANGHETMQFLAWTAMLLTMIGSMLLSNYRLLMPAGWLVAGMTLMVSMMSESNPQITNLMPVLQSPLLTIHVAIIMIAYCLLAFIMLNSIVGLIADRRLSTVITKEGDNEQAANELPIVHVTSHMRLSLLMLYPAVFCLTIGIFIGAVWANISWGRYWGWDPKEVWALITMLVYSFPLHSRSIALFRRPAFFHVYMIAAFLTVLFTYFGVNFLLGGMHAYQ